MKVILTAFAANLRSNAIEFPENMSDTINMAMDFSEPSIGFKKIKNNTKNAQIGVFKATNCIVAMAQDGSPIYEYKLREVI